MARCRTWRNVSYMNSVRSSHPVLPPFTQDMADNPDRESQFENERESAADLVLIALLQRGDAKALATIMLQYTDRLTRLAFYTTGSRDVADDIVQRVFVELWERRATLHLERLRPYLFRAVRNRAINECDATAVRTRYRATAHVEAAAIEPSPEDRILTETVVHSAVNQLSERRRFAIRLRFDEQMTHAEIGEVMEISPLAAQLLVTRALVDLRGILKK